MFYKELLSFVLFLLLPISESAVPGTFFWRPRLGIDLAVPTTEPPIAAFQPNKKNIEAGIVVLIGGYDILTSMLAMLQAVQFARDDDLMNPAKGLYYTGVYRWMLRTLELIPHWLRGNFHDALSVWHSRFKYMDAEVPVWMRKALPWVPKNSWDKENQDLAKFRKFSESAFTSFYKFPSKTFHNFGSFMPNSLHSFIFSSIQREEVISKENEEERKRREEELKNKLAAAAASKTKTTTAPKGKGK